MLYYSMALRGADRNVVRLKCRDGSGSAKGFLDTMPLVVVISLVRAPDCGEATNAVRT